MTGKFSNPEAVRLRLQGFAGDCVLAMEKALPQEAIHAVETAILPVATEDQRIAAYEEVKTLLESKGVKPDDPVLAAVTSRVPGVNPSAPGGKTK